MKKRDSKIILKIVIVACGAHKPRIFPFPGSEHIVSAYDFLKGINTGNLPELKDSKVVIL